jgi:nucleotide-binding universal stress UspA family protein
MRRVRRILFATDFSRASLAAWKESVAMGRTERCQLIVAHALRMQVPFTPEGYVLPQTSNELEAAVRKDATRQLKSLLGRTRKAGVRAQGLLLRGRPEDAIPRAAKKHGIDLVVVGTHGRTGLPRLVLGSVASRIIAAAGCPVLAVPSRSRAKGAR